MTFFEFLCPKNRATKCLADDSARQQTIIAQFRKEKLALLKPGEIDDVIYRQTGKAPCRRDSNIPYVFGDSEQFHWGYGGVGPCTFGFNILYHFTQDEEFCRTWCFDFVREFLYNLPMHDSGTIPAVRIQDWIHARRNLPVINKDRNDWSRRIYNAPFFEGFPPVFGQFLGLRGY